MQLVFSTGVMAAILLALVTQTGHATDPGSTPGGKAPAQVHGRPAAEPRPQQEASDLKDDEIYGHELMSADEIAVYRQQLGRRTAPADRDRFQRAHEERMRARAMEQSRDLVPPGQGPIYGGQLMSVEERNEYRERLRNMRSEAQRVQFEAQHREEIRKRAKALRIDIEEAE